MIRTHLLEKTASLSIVRTAASAPAPQPPEAVPQRNGLLAALPASELAMWQSSLERVRVNAGQVLLEADVAAHHAYFPVDAVISLVCTTEEGGCTEVAVIGREGMVGVGLFIGGSAGAGQAIVQCSGQAFRIRASVLREHFNRSAAVRDNLLRYLQSLLVQSAQMAVCNRHHTVQQQLCRWLLSALDRVDGHELPMTQELIATTLGVRRAGITEAITQLRKLDLVRCRRGRIAVPDRRRLEQHACGCYAHLRAQFRQLLPAAGRTSVLGVTVPAAHRAAAAPAGELHLGTGVTSAKRVAGARSLIAK
ncbi:MAG TPA: Crp/Fnr family transcriptional regulator [Candidatus Binatia bacterium]|nr:Crp/Fnr family transcriptional regulator [Candidatus Binatia bacterium]